jgi:hypothetical protein
MAPISRRNSGNFGSALPASQRGIIATIVDPAALPSVAARWALLSSAREIAFGQPWSHTVLHALELKDYARVGYATSVSACSPCRRQTYASCATCTSSRCAPCSR